MKNTKLNSQELTLKTFTDLMKELVKDKLSQSTKVYINVYAKEISPKNLLVRLAISIKANDSIALEKELKLRHLQLDRRIKKQSITNEDILFYFDEETGKNIPIKVNDSNLVTEKPKTGVSKRKITKATTIIPELQEVKSDIKKLSILIFIKKVKTTFSKLFSIPFNLIKSYKWIWITISTLILAFGLSKYLINFNNLEDLTSYLKYRIKTFSDFFIEKFNSIKYWINSSESINEPTVEEIINEPKPSPVNKTYISRIKDWFTSESTNSTSTSPQTFNKITTPIENSHLDSLSKSKDFITFEGSKEQIVNKPLENITNYTSESISNFSNKHTPSLWSRVPINIKECDPDDLNQVYYSTNWDYLAYGIIIFLGVIILYNYSGYNFSLDNSTPPISESLNKKLSINTQTVSENTSQEINRYNPNTPYDLDDILDNSGYSPSTENFLDKGKEIIHRGENITTLNIEEPFNTLLNPAKEILNKGKEIVRPGEGLTTLNTREPFNTLLNTGKEIVSKGKEIVRSGEEVTTLNTGESHNIQEILYIGNKFSDKISNPQEVQITFNLDSNISSDGSFKALNKIGKNIWKHIEECGLDVKEVQSFITKTELPQDFKKIFFEKVTNDIKDYITRLNIPSHLDIKEIILPRIVRIDRDGTIWNFYCNSPNSKTFQETMNSYLSSIQTHSVDILINPNNYDIIYNHIFNVISDHSLTKQITDYLVNSSLYRKVEDLNSETIHNLVEFITDLNIEQISSF